MLDLLNVRNESFVLEIKETLAGLTFYDNL